MSAENPEPRELRASAWLEAVHKARGRYRGGVMGATRTLHSAYEQFAARQREIDELEALWEASDDAT